MAPRLLRQLLWGVDGIRAARLSNPGYQPATLKLLCCALLALIAHASCLRCSTTGAMHAPYKSFDRHLDAIRARLVAAAVQPAAAEQPAAAGGATAAAVQQNGVPTSPSSSTKDQPPFYVVCRRGNDSQRAVAALRRAGISQGVDVVGGMEGWAREVDTSFPTY